MPKKLLVADDSLTIQKVIRLALSGAASGASDGYDIQTVSDGNDAIQQISLFRPDIVLIDVSLPGKSAFEVKRSTNQHRDLANVRFVLMSSAFEKVDEVQVQEVNFHGRLTKPFDPAHLREVLSQVLAQVSPHPGQSPQAPPPVPTLPTMDEEEEEGETTILSAAHLTLTPPSEPAHDLPPIPESFGNFSEPDADIRNLTESTIRMSGLADLGNEPQPTYSSHDLPPEPPSPSFSPGNFSSGPSGGLSGESPDDFQWNVVEEHSLKPLDHLDSGDSTFPLAPPAKIPNEHSRFIQRPPLSELEVTPPPQPYVPYDSNGQGSQEPPAIPGSQPEFDSTQLEEKIESRIGSRIETMIRREVENAIRKATHETLPEVVERIIKEEIHKLLQDSP
jgi:CheY-like chemotaxis protein